MLKDYPEEITRLQEVLSHFADRRTARLQPLNETAWSLEDELANLMAQADEDLEVARAGGDPEEIETAEKKKKHCPLTPTQLMMKPPAHRASTSVSAERGHQSLSFHDAPAADISYAFSLPKAQAGAATLVVHQLVH